jgi:hypothetical protein
MTIETLLMESPLGMPIKTGHNVHKSILSRLQHPFTLNSKYHLTINRSSQLTSMHATSLLIFLPLFSLVSAVPAATKTKASAAAEATCYRHAAPGWGVDIFCDAPESLTICGGTYDLMKCIDGRWIDVGNCPTTGSCECIDNQATCT